MWITGHRAQLRLGVRITAAILLSYGLCRALHLVQIYPAVLTAVIVMQASLGGSLKAMLDRFVGSLGGAAWSIAVLLAFHYSGLRAPGSVLMIAVLPLAFVAAFLPAYRAAPVTAIILLLTPDSAAEPLVPALERVLGIGLGSVAALVVALTVMPARAHGSLTEAAGRAVSAMGDLAASALDGLCGESDPANIQALHDSIRLAIRDAEAAADEAARERSAWLSAGPDPLPVTRTLRRLRNDLAMLGRAAIEPFPEPLQALLEEPATHAAATISGFLCTSGDALRDQRPAPPLTGVDEALTRISSAVTEVRQTGIARELSDETVERLFGLTFAFEQLRDNLADLAARTGELASRRASG